jgi:hypothetical protein
MMRDRAGVEAGEGAVPGEVVRSMIVDGLSGLAQASRAQPGGAGEESGAEPGLGRPDRRRRRLRPARDPAQAGRGARRAGLGAGG